MVTGLETEIMMGRLDISSTTPPPRSSTGEGSHDAITTDSTSANKPTGLLSLAAELRNTIYEFVFTDKDRGPTSIRRKHPHVKTHPLCQVNRQLRSETLSPFYSMTNFQSLATVDIYSFLCSLDNETIATLQSIRLCAASSFNSGCRSLETLNASFKAQGLKAEVLRLRVKVMDKGWKFVDIKEFERCRGFGVGSFAATIGGSPKVVMFEDSQEETHEHGS